MGMFASRPLSEDPSIVFCISKDIVTRRLEQNVRDLQGNMQSALHTLTALAVKLQTNRAHCVALAREFLGGVLEIKGLVRVILQLLTEVDSDQLRGKTVVMSVELLIVSLEEIGRWDSDFDAQCTRLQDSGSGVEPTLSKSWAFALFRNFSFCRTLLEVGFYRFFIELTMLGVLETPIGWNIGKDVADEFCNGAPLDLFEWCVRSCRPVLKQLHLQLGEQLMQHPHPGMDHLRPLLREARAERARCSLWTQVLYKPSAEPSDSLPLRVNFEDLEIVGPLGQGNYGTVLHCKWHDQDIAMKITSMNVAVRDQHDQFLKEVKILWSLRHPNIMRTFGYGADKQGSGFIIMELMETDLDRIIGKLKGNGRTHVFPLDVSMDLMSQIVEGLCALRVGRVCHRDLKPANILVNRLDNGIGPSERMYEAKFADFGNSKHGIQTSIFTTMNMGTPAYMAPEVHRDTGTENQGYSWKADVYSFGMVCSEILTGERPFQHLKPFSLKNVLDAVRSGKRPELLLDLEDPLRTLIEDCWKSEPNERPDVLEIRRRLSQCRLRQFSRSEGLRMSTLDTSNVQYQAAFFRDPKGSGYG